MFVTKVYRDLSMSSLKADINICLTFRSGRYNLDFAVHLSRRQGRSRALCSTGRSHNGGRYRQGWGHV